MGLSPARPGTPAESLADMTSLFVCTFGFALFYRVATGGLTSDDLFLSLFVGVFLTYLGQYFRRKRVEDREPLSPNSRTLASGSDPVRSP